MKNEKCGDQMLNKRRNILEHNGFWCVFFIFYFSFFIFHFATAGVEVVDIDHNVSSGALLELGAEKVVLLAGAGTLEFSPEQVLKLQADTLADPADSAELFLVALLRDGSRAVASDLALSNQTLHLTRPGGAVFSLKLSLVEGIRFSVPFREITEEVPEEIQKILQAKSAEDRLLITVGDALDYYGGIVREAGSETVQFELDGEVLAVPRRRIAALSFHQNDSPAMALPFCRLTERDGTSWELAELSFDRGQERFLWKTVLGVEGMTPFSQWDSADFTKANTVSLFQLTPVSAQWTPAVAWAAPREQEPILLWQQFAKSVLERPEAATSGEPSAAARPDSSMGRLRKPDQFPLRTLQGIQLDRKVYPMGYTLSARTVLEFSWADDYKTLRGLAGIDDRVRPNGRVKLTFLNGDAVLHETTIRGDLPAVPLSINLSGVKKLTIIADFPNGIDDGTRLHLVEMQLVK